MPEVPDCRLCAACCFSDTERYVQLSGEDHARLSPDERRDLVVFHGNRCYMKMESGKCAALVVLDGRFHCSIYERRPQLCRDYERGGSACAHDLAVRGKETAALLSPPRLYPVPLDR